MDITVFNSVHFKRMCPVGINAHHGMRSLRDQQDSAHDHPFFRSQLLTLVVLRYGSVRHPFKTIRSSPIEYLYPHQASQRMEIALSSHRRKFLCS